MFLILFLVCVGFLFFFVLGIPKAAKEVDSLSFPDILGL